LFMAYMFQFMCKYLPEKLILNSLDLWNIRLGHC
jgi:hypothetical protein